MALSDLYSCLLSGREEIFFLFKLYVLTMSAPAPAAKGNVWSLIFKDEVWLNHVEERGFVAVLIGFGLTNIGTTDCFLALGLSSKTDQNMIGHKGIGLGHCHMFFQSLKTGWKLGVKDTEEVIFPDLRLTLHVGLVAAASTVLEGTDHRAGLLVGKGESNKLCSYFTYHGDEEPPRRVDEGECLLYSEKVGGDAIRGGVFVFAMPDNCPFAQKVWAFFDSYRRRTIIWGDPLFADFQ